MATKDTPSYHEQLERLETLAPILLALHGVMMLASMDGGPELWALVGLAGLLGLGGLVWRPAAAGAAGWRAIALLVVTYLLLWATGGTASFFLLWYFVLVSVYPIVLQPPLAYLLPGLVAASYLLLLPLSPASLPAVVVAARTFLLLFIGLLTYRLGVIIQQHAVENAALVQQASDGIFVADASGRLLDANLSAAAMLGRSREALRRMPISDLIPPDDLAREPLHFDELLAGRTLSTERRLIRADGSRVPVEISAKRLPDGRLLAIVRDISLRRQAEERYRTISDLTSDYAYALRVDPDGTPRGEWLTEAFTRNFGYTIPEIDARGGLASLVYPDDLPVFQHHLQRVLSGEVDTCEMRFVTRGGEPRWLRDRARPVWDEQHTRVVRIYGASQDITERKRIMDALHRRAEDNAQLLHSVREQEQRLRALTGYLQSAREAERARIAREIHDELGQILTALKLDVTWLAKRLPAEAAPQHAKLEEMSALIDDTLRLVWRIAAELRPVLLDDLGLPAALDWQSRQFSQRSGIACQIRLPADDELSLDRERSLALFRIFQELLTNVARHAEATEVEASLESEDGVWVMRVRDNGRGVTEDQVANPKSLGLLGIRERAGQWGGTVDFAGEPGTGTTVTVRLPHRAEGKMDD